MSKITQSARDYNAAAKVLRAANPYSQTCEIAAATLETAAKEVRRLNHQIISLKRDIHIDRKYG